jgi:hypothetical protein
MEVLCFTVVFTRACHKLKGSTYLSYKLSYLTKWSKPTWEAIGCKISHYHSGTAVDLSSEMWNFVTGHVVTHVLKKLQSNTSGTTCPVKPHHITVDLKLMKSIHSLPTQRKKHIWNLPWSAFMSSDCRWTICCFKFMVSFCISVGINRLRVSSTKSHAWSILSMKVTQLLLQRIFPVSPVKHNTTCYYLCVFFIFRVYWTYYRKIFTYFFVP